MKSRVFLSGVALLFVAATSAFAQPAPDRAGDVTRIVNAHRQYFTGDDGRRELLKVVIQELNPRDGFNWGLLVKRDQGDKIPADIIVWRPTREHFDILTDSGPMWNPDGVLDNPSWQWLGVESGPAPPPGPTPAPSPQPSTFNLQPVLDAIAGLQNTVTALNQAVAALAAKPDPVITLPPFELPAQKCVRGKVSYLGSVTLCPVQ